MSKRVQAGWSGWRERYQEQFVTKELQQRVKGKVFKRVVRPVMFFGLEIVALTKRQETKLEVAVKNV